MSKTDRSRSPSRDDAPRREHLIQQCLLTLGKAWASSYFLEVSQANRSTAGGWPGRLAEARALVLRELTSQLADRGMDPPSASELASAPSTLNEHARCEWARAGKAQRQARRAAGDN